MKITKTILILTGIAAGIISACGSKKALTAASAVPAPTLTPPASAEPFVFAKPATGIYAPGEEELTAIQAQYKDATMEQLKTGHVIYTQGACINCHGAFSIYARGAVQWKFIIDDMAINAKISDTEKDAVYKYVLAMKATQPE